MSESLKLYWWCWLLIHITLFQHFVPLPRTRRSWNRSSTLYLSVSQETVYFLYQNLLDKTLDMTDNNNTWQCRLYQVRRYALYECYMNNWLYFVSNEERPIRQNIFRKLKRHDDVGIRVYVEINYSTSSFLIHKRWRSRDWYSSVVRVVR